MLLHLSRLVRHFLPWSLGRSGSLFTALKGIDREMQACHDTASAIEALERHKPELLALLNRQFALPAAQALAVKILNIYLARFHLRSRSVVVSSRPFGLVVDPSNNCLLACPGCVHSDNSQYRGIFDWGPGTLTEARFATLLQQYGPYCVGAYFCSYGEPLLNVRTPSLIRLAKNYVMWTALSTSLSVTRFDPEGYVESGLDFMVLAIDGATQQVYERYRRHGNLDLVLENARKLVAAKRRMGSRTPVLSWNFLAFEHNAHEISAARDLARKLGLDQFRLVNPFDVSWDDPGIRPAHVEGDLWRLKGLSSRFMSENWNPFPQTVDHRAIAQAFEHTFSLDERDSSPSEPGHTCHWLYKNTVMDATGRITPCCGAPRPDANLVFGAIDGSEGDPFNSNRYRQARAFFRSGATPADNPPYCTRCEWDQGTVNIGPPEIRRYFRGINPALFDRRTLRLLSGW